MVAVKIKKQEAKKEAKKAKKGSYEALVAAAAFARKKGLENFSR